MNEDLTFLLQAATEEVEEFLEPVALSPASQDPVALISDVVEIVRWYELLSAEVSEEKRAPAARDEISRR